jgi:hypothetical protein
MVSWESSLNKKNMSDPVSRNLARGWHPWDSHDRQPAFQLFRSRSHIRQVTYLRSASVWPKVTRCYKPFRGKKQKQPVLVTCRCFFLRVCLSWASKNKLVASLVGTAMEPLSDPTPWQVRHLFSLRRFRDERSWQSPPLSSWFHGPG